MSTWESIVPARTTLVLNTGNFCFVFGWCVFLGVVVLFNCMWSLVRPDVADRDPEKIIQLLTIATSKTQVLEEIEVIELYINLRKCFFIKFTDKIHY